MTSHLVSDEGETKTFSSGKFDLSMYDIHKYSLDIDHQYVREKCKEIAFFNENFF